MQSVEYFKEREQELKKNKLPSCIFKNGGTCSENCNMYDEDADLKCMLTNLFLGLTILVGQKIELYDKTNHSINEEANPEELPSQIPKKAAITHGADKI
ncbi:MAG: hypothetical protein ACTSPI_11890 [Candidatus Heimdallarchaeaceae archaeon]